MNYSEEEWVESQRCFALAEQWMPWSVYAFAAEACESRFARLKQLLTSVSWFLTKPMPVRIPDDAKLLRNVGRHDDPCWVEFKRD